MLEEVAVGTMQPSDARRMEVIVKLLEEIRAFPGADAVQAGDRVRDR